MFEIPNLIEKRLRAIASAEINERKLANVFIKSIRQAHSEDIPGKRT